MTRVIALSGGHSCRVGKPLAMSSPHSSHGTGQKHLFSPVFLLVPSRRVRDDIASHIEESLIPKKTSLSSVSNIPSDENLVDPLASRPSWHLTARLAMCSCESANCSDFSVYYSYVFVCIRMYSLPLTKTQYSSIPKITKNKKKKLNNLQPKKVEKNTMNK